MTAAKPDDRSFKDARSNLPKSLASGAQMPHVAFLDAVRGCAVLAVVMVHAHQNFGKLDRAPLPEVVSQMARSGQYGVQLFFIASAVTLAYSHDRRRSESSPTLKFWTRRFLRIAPLYYFGLVLYSLAWFSPLPFSQYPFLGLKAAVLNVLFLHPYSQVAFNSLPPGGWSIGVEMQFYALLPLVFVFVRSRWTALAFLVASLAACLAVRFHLKSIGTLAPENTFYYYWLPNQLPVFALGLLLYRFLKPCLAGDPRPSERPSLSLVASIAAVFATMALKTASNLYHLVAATTLAAFVYALAFSPWKVVVSRPLRTLGKLSFSIYIVHFLVNDLVFKLWRHTPAIVPSLVEMAAYYTAVLLLAAAFASLTYRFIEAPTIAATKLVIDSVEARLARRSKAA